jgi:hypothetical protein
VKRDNLSCLPDALAKVGPVGDVDPAVAAWRADATVLTWLEAL